MPAIENYRPTYDFGRSYRYHYFRLKQNGRKVYLAIDGALKKGLDSITIRDNKEFSDKVLLDILMGVLYDNWHFFYVRPQLTFVTFAGRKELRFHYNDYYNNRDMYLQRLESLSKTLFESLFWACTSPYETELTIYDYLTCSVEYELSDQSYVHTMIGPLLYGKGLCEGISQAFEMLCCCFGLNVSRISGILDGTPHSWNVIEYEGKLYHSDVTNDLENQTHRYFNRNDSAIGKTHSRFVGISPYEELQTYYNQNNTSFKTTKDLERYLNTVKTFTNDCFEFQIQEYSTLDDISRLVSRSLRREFKIVTILGCYKVLFAGYKKRFTIIHNENEINQNCLCW